MEILLIALTAFFASILTFFSGFGLGTILFPVFILFFPVDLAIALTGVVHFFNNLFKLILVGKKADKGVLLRFGLPAIVAAFIGSALLISVSGMSPIHTYLLFGKEMHIYPVKLMIAILLIIFAAMDLQPYLNKLEFGRNKLILGGLLSGFFGGLSGHQGALRSAFLIKAGLTKEAFIATGVVVACFIDFTRLSVYASKFLSSGLADNILVVVIATSAAITGAVAGNMLLKKITLKFIQTLVAILLIIIALALGGGVI
ncbi:MAG TPA: TSUP family transporter [Ignavibacteriaceae bacterium]|nr:TSUP family transporter [Ignavibacteriaceae bacterium]